MSTDKIRNVAVIAHVDHGKTTLMDQLMHESGVLGEKGADNERLMDANDLEKERGITIFSKCTTFAWQDYQFNMVDTPGHADFGGEVERVLGMVEGVLLLVDAAEGVLPGTKFVLKKALEQKLNPIVIINKMDKPEERADEVYEEIFELLLHLNATDEQLDFPLIYSSAKNGWAVRNRNDEQVDMKVIFESIIENVPPPKGNPTAPFQLLVTDIDFAPFLGHIVMGRIHNGTIKENMPIHVLDREGNVIEQGRIGKIFVNQGGEKNFIPSASAGSIVSITGLTKGTVSHTLADITCETPLPAPPIDPPTLTMYFSVNNSPLAGRDGDKLTSRNLHDRLFKEMQHNVSIQVKRTSGEGLEVAGRGELMLAVIIETMRREGFELSISPPKVIFKEDENGARLEPIENVQVDLEEEYLGKVMEKVNQLYANVEEVAPLGHDRFRLRFNAPTRSLIGLQSELTMFTRGSAIMNRSFKAYEKYRGDLERSRNGVLVSLGKGKALPYSLMNIQARGVLFIKPGDEVYEGMIIGEHNRKNDLPVNALKGKKLTNMRASGSDKEIKLAPPRQMTLEESISYIQGDEQVEVTPKIIRLRKVK